MSEFVRQYLGDFKELDFVYLVALIYAYETEKFDRSLSHKLDIQGVAIPFYRRLSTAHSESCKATLFKKYKLNREEKIRFVNYDKDLGFSLEKLEYLMRRYEDQIKQLKDKGDE